MRVQQQLRRRHQRLIEIAQKAVNRVKLYRPSRFTEMVAAWECHMDIVRRFLAEIVEWRLAEQQIRTRPDVAMIRAHYSDVIARDSWGDFLWHFERWWRGQLLLAGDAREFARLKLNQSESSGNGGHGSITASRCPDLHSVRIVHLTDRRSPPGAESPSLGESCHGRRD